MWAATAPIKSVWLRSYFAVHVVQSTILYIVLKTAHGINSKMYEAAYILFTCAVVYAASVYVMHHLAGLWWSLLLQYGFISAWFLLMRYQNQPYYIQTSVLEGLVFLALGVPLMSLAPSVAGRSLGILWLIESYYQFGFSHFIAKYPLWTWLNAWIPSALVCTAYLWVGYQIRYARSD